MRVSFVAVLLLAFVLIARGAAAINVAAASNGQVTAAMGTLCRTIPDHCGKFTLSIDPSLAVPHSHSLFETSSGPKGETFTVSASNGIVKVAAATGVGLTSGAYWYLKNVTRGQVTWGENRTGVQLNLPAALPDVAATTVTSSVPVRYAWNMCTFSYSGAFWDKARWQREIDWMALHGVNVPLALTAQEFVWMEVFAEKGVPLSEIESWFSGPAFLAWQRAGNIRGFAGPLTRHWIDGQMELQRSILSQMRALGMIPILPCFAGHVPKVVAKLYPNASLHQSPPWNHFPPNFSDVYILDPTDPAYVEIGALYMKHLVKQFGTDHYYSCDTFNEVNPTSTDPTYLKHASAAVVTAISAVDPKGVWVMQAWLFHNGFWTVDRVQAYLSGVSNSRMLILDLNSEAGTLAPQFDNYFGKPWVWNMLHNYGGVRGVYGNLTCIANKPFDSLASSDGTMVGIGFTPEAIEQNPVMYEMLTSTFWGGKRIDTKQWLQNYVSQRYGPAADPLDSTLQRAWGQLFDATYSQPGEARSEIEWVPHWETNQFGWQNGNATGVFAAWETYLSAADDVKLNASTNGPYQYDLVDITRQSLTMFFSDTHRMLEVIAMKAQYDQVQNWTTPLKRTGDLMKTLIMKIDALLGTNPNYLLGLWTTRATNWAQNDTETGLYLYNAKNQVTMWGPDAQICDYAAKAWHGLYGTYYHERWSIMIDMLVNEARNSSYWEPFVYTERVKAFEQTWDKSNQTFSPVPSGTGADAISIAKEAMSLVSNPNWSAEFNEVHGVFCDESQAFYIDPFWTTDPRQLSVLCDLHPDCVAFDSNGWLYTGKKASSDGFTTTYFRKSKQ